MKIKDAYNKFSVAPNLQEHMIRVARVANYIKCHWIGPEVNWELLKKAALLHDIGNIVKFVFDVFPIENVEYWKKKQKEIIQKYGFDDHEVTKKMLLEINAPREIFQVISGMSFGGLIEVSKSDFWELKIISYCDYRVLPSGIGSLEERLNDVRKRYAKYRDRKDFPEIEKAVRDIENQIGKNMNRQVSEITDKILSRNDEEFLDLEI